MPVSGSATYYVRVRAANATGSSVPSNEVVVSVGGALPRPSAPVDLSALITGATVMLTWEPPASGDLLSGYRIDVGSSPGASNLATLSTTDSSRTFRANVPVGTYYARVRAINVTGMSPPSNEATVRVDSSLPCFGPPSLRGQLNVRRNSTNIEFSGAPDWPVSSYVIELGSASGLADLSIYEAPAREDYGLSLYVFGTFPRGTYFVRARAKNACGTGPASNEVRIALQ